MSFVEFGKRKKIYMQLRDIRQFLTLKFSAALVAALLLAMQPLSVFAAPVISEVMPDPVTITDTQGQWIEIHNQGSESSDISGWTLNDGGSVSYTFPTSTVLTADQYYVVCRTMATAEANCDAEWSNMSLLNSGDTVTLKNASSATEDTFTYTGSNEGESAEAVTEDNTTTAVNNSTESYGTNGNTGTPGAANTAQSTGAVMNERTGERFSTLQTAIDDADTTTGDVIALSGDLTATSQTTVSKSVTIDGNGHTLTPDFTKTDNDNNAAIGITATNNVTVSDLTIDGVDGFTLHGINVFKSTGVEFNNLTIQDNDRYGVVVNSSDITIDSLTTSGNGWGGVNVDQTSTAILAHATMTGVNSHDEFVALYVEGTGASMTDSTTNQQYYEYPAGSGLYHTKQSDLGPVVNTTTRKAYDTVQAAISDSATTAGDLVEINTDLTLTQQLTINKAVTLDGNEHTITGSFTKSSNSNNAVIGVQSNDVTISSLTVDAVDGATKQLHGINVYGSTGVILTDIVAKNGRSGVVVGQGANVTINGITTSGNIWHGINVDKPGSHLTISGTNIHSEARPIFVDNKTVGVVVYTDNQYSVFEEGNERTYVLTSSLSNGSTGTITLPTSGGVAKTPTNSPLTITLGQTTVVIPAGTTISANNSAWDGTILAPTSSTYIVAGSFQTGLAITVGSNNYTLEFDNPVKIVLSGEAGKRVGFVPAQSSSFTEITTVCEADDQATAAAQLLALGVRECKIDSGGNLIVWTKHFTTFVAYNVTAPAPMPLVPTTTSSDSTFASIFNATPVTTSSTTQTGDVLGTKDVKEKTMAKTAAVIAPSAQGWTLFGVAWYWWLLLTAAVATASWFVLGRRRV